MSDVSKVAELTLKLLDGGLDESEQRELDTILSSDPEAEREHLALMAQEAALRGTSKDRDLSSPIMDRVRQAAQTRLEQGIMNTIKPFTPRRPKPVEDALPWLGGRVFWGTVAMAAAILLIVFAWRAYDITQFEALPQEAVVYGTGHTEPGAETLQRVFVRDGQTQEPIANATVQLAVYEGEAKGEPVWTQTAKTDGGGLVLAAFKIPVERPEGTYTLKVEATSDKGTSTVERPIEVKRTFKVLVTTDKPLYQPGQTIHLRALALASASRKPVADTPARLEVFDAKGNKVFGKTLQTSRFGIISADFVLADQVNLGQYKISAVIGDTTSERAVTVSRYTLPRFRVDITPDRGYYAPGEKATGVVEANYTFGKPVEGGQVKIVASEFVESWRPFGSIEGKVDAEGRFAFEIPLKDSFVGQPLKKGDALVSLEVTVTDPAGQSQTRTRELAVSAQPLHIELFPESGTLVSGVENVIYVLTAYPDGRPAKTRVKLGQNTDTIETSEAGMGLIRLTPNASVMELEVSATDKKGTTALSRHSLKVDSQVDAFLMRTDKAVYTTGQTVKIEVLGPPSKVPVFVDVIQDRRTALTRTVEITEGRGALALDLPADLAGTLQLHAYRIRPDGDMTSETRLIQVVRADALTIEATLDKDTYRPAEKALLQIAVRRKNGEPVQAALGLSGVDEAVFALQEMRPGLERVYFMLQEELLKPNVEVHQHRHHPPVDHEDILEPDPSRETAIHALFAAAEPIGALEAQISERFLDRQNRVQSEANKALEALLGTGALFLLLLFFLLTAPFFLYAGWRLVDRTPMDLEDELDGAGLWRAIKRTAVWWGMLFYLPLITSLLFASAAPHRYEGKAAFVGAILSGGFVLAKLIQWVIRARREPNSEAAPLLRQLLVLLPFAGPMGVLGVVGMVVFGQDILSGGAQGTVTLLVVIVASMLIGAIPVCGASVLRPISRWGLVGVFVVQTAIFVFGLLTAIIVTIIMAIVFQACSQSPMDTLNKSVSQMEGADAAMTDAAASASKDANSSDGSGGGPRVRRHFPETLLWIPELITDASGKASLEIPLADSITTWRMSMSAVSGQGELGAGTKPLRVFQDFFVDIDMPVAMTQNDKLEVPIAIFNYLDAPQTIRLEVEPAPWFSLSGPSTVSVKVGPGEVTSVALPLEALKPGRHALLVRAIGSEMSDAVERPVEVKPDGDAVVETLSGRLDGDMEAKVVISEEAIDGANDLFVKIYPGTFSQVAEGLDSLFKMPYGCFEQTSSATYPNVLVLDYLRQTGQTSPELELKALGFINQGYQRLLSYEVPGGGFEWFGKTPAHTVLTAYGLMEFSDMARVHDVDPDVISRTRGWLFAQQKQDGTWEPTAGGIAEGAINQYQGQTLRTTAYIAWAMAESAGDKPLESKLQLALDHVARHFGASDDPYTLAVSANALVAGKHPAAGKVFDKLMKLAKTEDKLLHWTSNTQGVAYSRGDVLAIETTALAAYAMLQSGDRVATAHKALGWLMTRKDALGNWHSTQATIHSLRALLLAAQSPGGEVEGTARVTVRVGGKVAKVLEITEDNKDIFHLISLREYAKEGTNTVNIDINGAEGLAYQLVSTHYVPRPETPAQDTKKPMTIDVKYDTTNLATGDILRSTVEVAWHREGVAEMSIVDLGIPPGFEVVPGTFEGMIEKGQIERFSIAGRQVILYVREIKKGTPLRLGVQMRAKYPVKVQAPAIKTYQYYEPEVRDETRPTKLTVL